MFGEALIINQGVMMVADDLAAAELHKNSYYMNIKGNGQFRPAINTAYIIMSRRISAALLLYIR